MKVPESVAPDGAERYEALRSYALGEAPLDVVPLGLSVLCHRGVVAWLLAEREMQPLPRRGPEPNRAARSAATPLSARASGELVGLLATAALRVARGGVR